MTLKRSCGIGMGLALLIGAMSAPSHGMDKIPDQYKIDGIAIGCQAWSFNHQTVRDAIRLTHAAGGKVIEFYPGQPLSPEDRSVKFDHNVSDEVIAQVKQWCKDADVLPVNYGVVSAKSADEWQKIFEFAKKLDLYGVTSEPSEKDMDTIEKLVKEFDIHFSIHDHPKQLINPGYKFWDPNYVLSLVKNRDPRMGACADTGHWITSGVDPIKALHILKGRIMSAHMKDRNKKGAFGHDVPWGTGVGECKQILEFLKFEGFQGNVDVEYEYQMEKDPETDAPKSFPDIKQSISWAKEQAGTSRAQ